MADVEFDTAAVHKFTVALIETFYEGGHVTDAELEKMRGNDNFIDNDEFALAYEEHIWTDENADKFGDLRYDDMTGYFLRDED
jgi:hypothetical protein